MRKLVSTNVLLAVVIATAVALLTASTGSAAPFHGLGVLKGCDSPTPVYGAYTCAYRVTANAGDGDTYSFNSVIDAVAAHSGTVTSPNLIGSVGWVITAGSASCSGGTGTGTSGDPFIGATSCTLSPDGQLTSQDFSFYTVQPADFTNAMNRLTDTATVSWTDVTAQQSGSNQGIANSLITQNPSTTATTIQPGSTIAVGTSVNDSVTVSPGAGSPQGAKPPTGTVTFSFFSSGNCAAGTQVGGSETDTLDANGQFSGALQETPTAAGSYGYQAVYNGDNAYVGSTGTCEPLTVVDANISLSPLTATNPVGTSHTVTCTINQNLGSGFVAAPNNTACNWSITAGPNSGQSGSCPTSSGSCMFTYNDTGGAGTDTIHATTTFSVAGVSLTRSTGDGVSGDSANAQKMWVTPQGIIAPTQTTCQDFTSGTAATLGQVNYSLSGKKIGQGINPGVFFFYTKITTTTPNQVVTVTQTNTSTNNTPNFGILNGQAWLYPANCSSHTVGTTSGPNDENASYTVKTPGTYIIGIKYQTKTIAGAPAPIPANITYNFTTSLGGNTGASVLLKKS